MANETTVVVSADATGYTASLEKAKASAQSFMATQDAAAQRVKVAQQAIAEAAQNGSTASARALNNFVSQLARTAEQAGKTRAELLAMRAASLGISDSVSGYISNIAAASEHTHSFSLATSGARRELAVLAHEAATGNWSRFAGSLGVLGERTGAISLLFSGAGVALIGAAAAAALFFYEIDQGAKQVEAFNKAVTSTGGVIGLSSDQMITLSNGLQTTGTSLSTVREAMAQVAATGAFTADNLALATEAATAMSQGIGISTDKAAEALAKIRDGVMEWVTSYQAAHHTFNAAQIEEIEGFVKLGDTAGATSAIMRDIVSAQAAVEVSAQKNIGAVADWWNQLVYSVERVKNAVMDIGVPTGVTQQLTAQLAVVQGAQRNLDQQKAMGMMGNTVMAQQQLDIEMKKLNVLRDQQAELFKANNAAAANARSGDAKLAVDSYLKSPKYATPAQKHTEDLDAENADFAKATKDLDKNSADYQAALKRHYDNVEQINKEYAKKSQGPSNNAAIQDQLAKIQAQNKLVEDEEKRKETALKAQRDAGVLSEQDYLKQINDAQKQALTQEIAYAQQRADVASGKKEKAAMDAALGDVKELTAQRVALEQNYRDSMAVLKAQEAADLKKYAEQQQASLDSQTGGYASKNATRYMSSQDKANYDAALALYEDYQRAKTALKEQYEGPTADQQQFAQKLQTLDNYYQQKQTALAQDLQNEQNVRNSYTDQMHSALVALGGDSQTNAQIMGSAFTKSIGDMQSALDTFVTTGKLSFSSFAASVLDDIAKIALHAAESQIFQSLASSSFFSNGGSVGTSVGSYATGGAISGPGSGTSDSIPAMLSNGEFVVKASATAKYRSLLESINNGNMSHFASGGVVGSVAASAPTSSTNTTLHMNVQNGNGGLSSADLVALAPTFQALIDKRIAQKTMGQGGIAYRIRNGQI